MVRYVVILLLALGADLSLSYPAEQPTKFDLNTTDDNAKGGNGIIASKLQKGQEMIGRIMDAIRIGRGRIVNSVSLARNIVADRAEILASETQNNVASAIALKGDILNRGKSVLESIQSAPIFKLQTQTARETVRLENEAQQSLAEKQLPKPVERVLESFLKPTPIVDGIREEEKYGNSGDKFIGIGRALVGGFEGLSNFLNGVVDFPVNAAKKTSRGITNLLNEFGARLVGLQK